MAQSYAPTIIPTSQTLLSFLQRSSSASRHDRVVPVFIGVFLRFRAHVCPDSSTCNFESLSPMHLEDSLSPRWTWSQELIHTQSKNTALRGMWP